MDGASPSSEASQTPLWFPPLGIRSRDSALPELAPTTAGGFVGTISFPNVGGVLREDAVDADLGAPRDLNADGVVDSNSRASDYVILPIRVRLTWIPRNARTGQRTFEMFTMYARY